MMCLGPMKRMILMLSSLSIPNIWHIELKVLHVTLCVTVCVTVCVTLSPRCVTMHDTSQT